MSDPVDVMLADPSEAELVAALEQASFSKMSAYAEIRSPAQIAEFVRNRWKTQRAEVVANAEGQMAITQMIGPRDRTDYVLLAWWSDHCGGKHVRIRGGDKVNLRTHLSRLDRDERPPLWQVYPERVYRVKRGDAEPVWLASCACGVTGPPREIAWMGPRCGPCHDRREEGDTGAVSEGKTILREGGVVNALAFSPDNEAIAAVIHKKLLVQIRLKGEECILYGDTEEELRPDEALAPVTFSPNGRWLAFGDAATGQLLVMDLHLIHNTPYPIDFLSISDDESQEIVEISYSPSGEHFAACDESRRGRLFRWIGSLWAEVKSFRGATAVAISTDGQRLAIGGSGGIVRLYSTDSGAKLGQVTTGARSEESVLFLAWTPKDDGLILLTGDEDAERFREDHQLRRWDLLKRRETHYTDFGIPSLLAMSPDSRYLASIHHDDQHSPSAIHFWDLVAWHEVGWIEWDPEDTVHALAFSPDNETLAIGTHHGRIKLIPWRLLLVG